MGLWTDVVGTVRDYIRLGLTGVRLKNSSGALAVRNAGDSAYANVECGDVYLGPGSKLVFEGTTADAYETTVDPGDPTADRTLTLPNKSGTLATTGDVTAVPAGSVFWFAADTPPTGYLECDGSAVSRTAYADLFAVTGTTFGVGDGSTTFNLPDLRGEFIRGWDNSRGVDSGRAFGSAQSDAVVDHKHKMGTIAAAAGSDALRGPANYGTGTAQLSSGAFDTAGSSTIGGAETRPRNIALLPCIKY